VVVLDNLREGVLSPDFYDPGVNPLYRDVLAHYGVTALPCKVRDPDRKGKVESGVNHFAILSRHQPATLKVATHP
jgi:transposase